LEAELDIELIAERIFEKTKEGYTSSIAVSIDNRVITSSVSYTEDEILKYQEAQILDCVTEYDKAYNRIQIMREIRKQLFGDEPCLN
jgi:hypothetical protein